MTVLLNVSLSFGKGFNLFGTKFILKFVKICLIVWKEDFKLLLNQKEIGQGTNRKDEISKFQIFFFFLGVAKIVPMNDQFLKNHKNSSSNSFCSNFWIIDYCVLEKLRLENLLKKM